MILGDFVWKLSSKQRQISARADEWKGNPLLETQFSPMTTQLYMILLNRGGSIRWVETHYRKLVNEITFNLTPLSSPANGEFSIRDFSLDLRI